MAHRYVEFHSKEIKLRVQAQMTGPAVPVNHYPEGWQQVQRLMRRSFPEWQGSPGWEIQIPVVFDGHRLGASKEQSIRRLERLAEPTRKFDPMRPPFLRFDANGDIPYDHTNYPRKLWIIAGTGLEWGDYITKGIVHPDLGGHEKDRLMQADTGSVDPFHGVHLKPYAPGPRTHLEPLPTFTRYKRTRQFCIIHLWEVFEAEVVTVSLHNQPYKIKKGDTLQKIAREFYGDPSKWREIAKKNHIRDPNHPRVGRTIHLP